jgi:hypothetical protein
MLLNHRLLRGHPGFSGRLLLLLLLSLTTAATADQVHLRNGDRYAGKVLSVNTNSVLLDSPVLGRLTLPRAQVASISFLETTNAPALVSTAPASATLSASPAGVAPATGTAPAQGASLENVLKELKVNSNVVAQVRGEFLAGATPEANQKFDQMLNGLLTGKLNLGDLRKEAASTADQLRELKQDLGEDAGFAIDGYLAILENFLRQTPPPAAGSSGAPNPHPPNSP